ncbi:MAG TPA: M20/M25/M40 family metallo-hydrolase, partial [Gemmatimonadaceae bacterium]|nr:M20/M25/M40 family metallo-hydrolase [Gemmatimonadaceae bacterium]
MIWRNVILAVLSLAVLSAGVAGAQTPVGYTPASGATERTVEAAAAAVPSPADAAQHSRALSYKPHMAGTPAQAETRDYVVHVLREWGIETSVRAYDVYMPHPLSVHVWRLGSDTAELSLPEGPVPGDTTSSAYPQIPTFNGYGAPGDVSGEVVYVNYGLIEDYAHLDSIGVSVAGKIAIARYGRSFRGIKAREAEKHGALALFIYSDPAEDGYMRGDVFPAGAMRPAQGVQRGSVMNDNGDPSTPGYPSLPGVPRLTPDKMAIPHIPVVPLSYRNAALLLGELHDGRDSVFPQRWQGGLPFRYHIGPGPARARVAVAVDTGRAAYKTIWDTFGTIRGTTYPNEVIVIGGHRDAWGPGTADNVSGVTSVLEAAHAVADAVRHGHRPKRTIVFATWDAEEWGLLGSTEYVEEDSLRLTKGAVAYFNQDVAADGQIFQATGSPSLREMIRDIARRNGVAIDSTTTFGDPGGGSDFSGFYNHLGIPIAEWGFGGRGGVYHSAYDDTFWMERYGDPGYVRHAQAGRISAMMVLRLANADIEPLDYVEYARTMQRYVAPLGTAATAKGMMVSTTGLSTAIGHMALSAERWTAARDSALAVEKPRGVEAANAALRHVERSLTRPAGLRTRPWFRNL